MTDENRENRDLCLALMLAETDEEIVDYLSIAGYWDNPSAWRFLGDVENNFGTIGNQQADPVAALVEKIVNSIDARLVGACLAGGTDPASDGAPRTPREAVARFFEPWHDFNPSRPDDGLILDWTGQHMTDESREITVTAAGSLPSQGAPSISIADTGEGQIPDAFPDTLMSLNRSNKLRIPFVQGRFNMGGTGAFRFCGTEHQFQLIVSRRSPALVASDAPERDRHWGFTIVRRTAPSGATRNPVYEYLAPCEGRGVLSFSANTLPIRPDERPHGSLRPTPYGLETEWGTLIKLFDYRFGGDASSTIGATGLARRVEGMLPRATLPMRFVDSRYARHSGLAVFGVETRLKREKDRVLDLEVSGALDVAGTQLPVTAYVFKPGRARTYRPSAQHAVVFEIDGQTHASLPSRFFTRGTVRKNYLARDLFVIVDCSRLEAGKRFDLFMNSRDRMTKGPLRDELERALEVFLKESAPLGALNQERREASLKDKVLDQGTTRDIVSDVMKRSPELRRVLADGLGILIPKIDVVPEPFEGKRFPTYFNIVRSRRVDGVPTKTVAVGSRVLIEFETDAADDYFSRTESPGSIVVVATSAASSQPVDTVFGWHGPSSGEARIWFNGLSEDCEVGDVIQVRVEITDDDRTEPLRTDLAVVIKDKPSPPGKSNGRKKKKQKPQLDLPRVIPVWKHEWIEYNEEQGFGFDKYTAVDARPADDEGHDDRYDIYVNMNNVCLDHARRSAEANPVLDARWTAVMTLASMFLLSNAAERGPNSSEEDGYDRSALIRRATRGIAPIVMHLGDVFAEDPPDGG